MVLLLFFAACYKDGPIISFRSKEKRLLGDWKVISLTVDGVDSTQYYNDSCGCGLRIAKNLYEVMGINYIACKGQNYVPSKYFSANIHFEKNNNYLFVHNESNLSLHFIGPIAPGEFHWRILKLTNNKFSFECSVNNKIYFFKLS